MSTAFQFTLISKLRIDLSKSNAVFHLGEACVFVYICSVAEPEAENRGQLLLFFKSPKAGVTRQKLVDHAVPTGLSTGCIAFM